MAAFLVQRGRVSIHAPAWGATRQGMDVALIWQVSIHAPAWGATFDVRASAKRARSFNPRTRVGCDLTLRVMVMGTVFQSTHPRGVRPGYYVGGLLSDLVSIHAPAWGATGAWPLGTNPRNVSIHAPAWGATHITGGICMYRGRVSIHAPAWGATLGFPASALSSCLFQSTHPRGVRHAALQRIPHKRLVSIHAPAWGATRKTLLNLLRHKGVSIHAPAWGATVMSAITKARAGGFNPRTRVGCDCFHVLSSRFP